MLSSPAVNSMTFCLPLLFEMLARVEQPRQRQVEAQHMRRPRGHVAQHRSERSRLADPGIEQARRRKLVEHACKPPTEVVLELAARLIFEFRHIAAGLRVVGIENGGFGIVRRALARRDPLDDVLAALEQRANFAGIVFVHARLRRRPHREDRPDHLVAEAAVDVAAVERLAQHRERMIIGRQHPRKVARRMREAEIVAGVDQHAGRDQSRAARAS